MFLLTDLLKYKPMIVFEALAYVVTWILLIWANGVAAMQAMEFTYGVATSTEVAYYTYIYAKVLASSYNTNKEKNTLEPNRLYRNYRGCQKGPSRLKLKLGSVWVSWKEQRRVGGFY